MRPEGALYSSALVRPQRGRRALWAYIAAPEGAKAALWRLFVGFGPSPLGTERKRSPFGHILRFVRVTVKRPFGPLQRGPFTARALWAYIAFRPFGGDSNVHYILRTLLSPVQQDSPLVLFLATRDASCVAVPLRGRQRAKLAALWAYIASPKGRRRYICLSLPAPKGAVCAMRIVGFGPSPKGTERKQSGTKGDKAGVVSASPILASPKGSALHPA